MPFIPSSTQSTIWTAENTPSGASAWATDAITEVYDLLVDEAGNYIVDIDGNFISLGGGIVVSSPAAVGTITSNSAIIASSWTPEG